MAEQDQVALLGAPQTLPISGAIAPNRFFKAPTEEYLCQLGATTATVNGKLLQIPGRMPSETHLDLYQAYAQGGWGIITTGNVMVDPTQLGGPMDIALPTLLSGAAQAIEEHLALPNRGVEAAGHTLSKLYAHSEGLKYMFNRFAMACRNNSDAPADGSRPLALMQINHAGRQSMRGSGRGVLEPAWAPSANRIKVMTPPSGSGWKHTMGSVLDELAFGTPKAMTLEDIARLKTMFKGAALMCQASGFDGVQIHAAHGYQLAAFLSPLTNQRTDQYGGSNRNRAQLLLELASETRQLLGPKFVIAVKLNSADYIAGGQTEKDALETVSWLTELNAVDLIEISGGTYESPVFLTLSSGETPTTETSKPLKPREALFFSFAHESRDVVTQAALASKSTAPALCITGGLKTRGGMASAISDAHADFVGIARYAAVYPALPSLYLGLHGPAIDRVKEWGAPQQSIVTRFTPALIGGGWSTEYTAAEMRITAFVHRLKQLAQEGHFVRKDALRPASEGVPLLDAFEAVLVGVLPPAWTWVLFKNNWLATGRIYWASVAFFVAIISVIITRFT